MDIQLGIYTLVAIAAIAYIIGCLTYWWMARHNLRALKRYRTRERVLRQWNRPVE